MATKKVSSPLHLVDAAELASTLGVSARTLARMVANGTISAPIEMGRLRRWDLNVVTADLKRHQKGGRR